MWRVLECVFSSVQRERERKVDSKKLEDKKRWMREDSRFLDSFSGQFFLS